MELVALPGWALGLVVVVGAMLVVGVLEALAARLGNDRDRHDLIVQAMRLRDERLRSIRAQLQSSPAAPEEAAPPPAARDEPQTAVRKQAA